MNSLFVGLVSVVLCCVQTLVLAYDTPNHQTHSELYLPRLQEYCLRTNSEPFEASCLKNEVVVMNSATYGRMRIGTCLQAERTRMLAASVYRNDPLFLGCSVNVLGVLDRKCSGRNRCELRGSDEELEREKPCHVELKHYLEAGYECVFVVEPDRSCLVTLSQQWLHIARSTSSGLRCGTIRQPWMLEAPVGQQINVSLLEFGSEEAPSESSVHRKNNCPQYGFILDKSVFSNVSICRENHERLTFIYTSRANYVEIVLHGENSEKQDASPSFLVRVVAIGCSNIVPPEDMWLRRDGNGATVGCYSSRQFWDLHCAENNWVGVIGNCTRDLTEDLESKNNIALGPPKENYEMMVVLAVSFFGLASCLAVVCLGVVCWKRYYAQYQKYNQRGEVNVKISQAECTHQKMIIETGLELLS